MQYNEAAQQAADEQQDTTSSASEGVSLEQQLEGERHKAQEYLDMLRRTQADFINYKRRTNQDQEEERLIAQASVLGKLLPILDDLGRALATTPPELANHPWVEGILLVRKRLITTLEQMGVRSVGTVGEMFNPHLHEALLTENRTDVPEGTIVSIARPGYALGERIIRPAQVIVAAS